MDVEVGKYKGVGINRVFDFFCSLFGVFMYASKTKAAYMMLPWCNFLNIDVHDSGVWVSQKM